MNGPNLFEQTIRENDVNGPMGVEEAGDMSAKDQGEDSVVESEKMSWQDQRHECNSRPYSVIKKPIRYLD